MKVFLDSANLEEIEACLARGFISGITTNPSLLKKEPKTDFVKHIKKIANLCRKYKRLVPLSVEVFTAHPNKMVVQAVDLMEKINYENLNIKIPMGWDELGVINELAQKGIKVNCTCLFTEAQCMIAANAGAKYVSLFMNRMKDVGIEPTSVIADARALLDDSNTDAEIIVGSIRHERDIIEAQLAGAHIVTSPTEYFRRMTVHPQTIKSVAGFLKDFEDWLK
jgi:transaldolase